MTYHSQSIAAQENSATGNNTNTQYRLEDFGEKGTFILAGKKKNYCLQAATLLGSPQAPDGVQDTTLWVRRES